MEIFQNGNDIIYYSDAINVLENYIKDESIDLIFVVPPYNIGKNFAGLKDKWKDDESYLQWCYKWLELCIKKIKPNGSLYVMTSTQFMPYFDIFFKKQNYYIIKNCLVL